MTHEEVFSPENVAKRNMDFIKNWKAIVEEFYKTPEGQKRLKEEQKMFEGISIFKKEVER
jgi:hypothetical protein